MSNPFITNDPHVKHASIKIQNVGTVKFLDGVLDPDLSDKPDEVRKALMERKDWPIYGVHFHLRDKQPVPPEKEEARVYPRPVNMTTPPPEKDAARVHHGPVGTTILKGKEKA